MPLHKVREFYPDYREQFGDHDILGYSLYAGAEKVGAVDDLLVDDEGRFRYLLVNTGAWIFGKKVLLPIGQARIDYSDRKVYADGLTRDQVENLPEYDSNATDAYDYDYEEKVRGVYRPAASADSAMMGSSASLDTTAPLDAAPAMYNDTTTDANIMAGVDRTPRTYDRSNYQYDYDPDLYNMNDQNHQTLKLYEERLVAGKTRQKTGEIGIGKRVETETQRVAVPVEKERVVIERITPTHSDVAATVGTGAFQEGEVVRMEVFEETPEIRKEAFVREEVRVHKEVEQSTVETQETIRKEQLNVDKDGNPVIQQ